MASATGTKTSFLDGPYKIASMQLQFDLHKGIAGVIITEVVDSALCLLLAFTSLAREMASVVSSAGPFPTFQYYMLKSVEKIGETGDEARQAS